MILILAGLTQEPSAIRRAIRDVAYYQNPTPRPTVHARIK